MTDIAITTDTPDRLSEAQTLAKDLDIPFFAPHAIPAEIPWTIILTPHFIGLKATHKRSAPIYVDFMSGKMNYRLKQANFRNELIARAMGQKPEQHPIILDATAGFGRDSFILATLGFEVIMLEKSPIVHLLLKDGIERAAKIPELANIMKRLTLFQADAINWLTECLSNKNRPDVIYLDPMFPERKKSASVKKEMLTLQELLPKDENVLDLFDLALTCAVRRVVVKRPRLAQSINDKAPNYSLIGKSSRFDIYLAKEKHGNYTKPDSLPDSH